MVVRVQCPQCHGGGKVEVPSVVYRVVQRGADFELRNSWRLVTCPPCRGEGARKIMVCAPVYQRQPLFTSAAPPPM